jgi:hypothetical protein
MHRAAVVLDINSVDSNIGAALTEGLHDIPNRDGPKGRTLIKICWRQDALCDLVENLSSLLSIFERRG